MNYNDPLYSKQWYLVNSNCLSRFHPGHRVFDLFSKENEGQLNTPPLFDLNVVVAWQAGYTGAGVSICIVDDGVQHSHPDLSDNYVSGV